MPNSPTAIAIQRQEGGRAGARPSRVAARRDARPHVLQALDERLVLGEVGGVLLVAAGPSPREGFNFNAVVAKHCLKNPVQTVTFVHPRSRLNGKTAKL